MRPIENLERRELLTSMTFEVASIYPPQREIVVYSVSAIDMDQDGDLDFLGIEDDNDLMWLEFDSHRDRVTRQHDIDGLTKARTILPADVDGDGDMDVVAAAITGSKFS
ncbi:MAG: hypothetical protein R3C28_18885 [Pirellulaceae bacterium]